MRGGGQTDGVGSVVGWLGMSREGLRRVEECKEVHTISWVGLGSAALGNIQLSQSAVKPPQHAPAQWNRSVGPAACIA